MITCRKDKHFSSYQCVSKRVVIASSLGLKTSILFPTRPFLSCSILSPNPVTGEAEGAYLKEELVGSGEGGSSVVRPVGVSLEAGGGGAEASKFGTGSGGRTSGGAKGSGSGSGGKKKPSWLKIN